MTHDNYNINTCKLATRLIILGLISAFEACACAPCDRLIVGDTAQSKINAIKKYSVEVLDRNSLQKFLDREV